MAALCAGLECNYDYFETTAMVTDMTVSGTNVVITGTGLTTDTLLLVEISNMECVTSSVTDTSITCDLVADWTAGSWLPHVKTDMGIVPVDSAVSPYDVSHDITSITPALLNPAGGDQLVI